MSIEQVSVIAALVISCGIFLFLGFRESHKIRSINEYLPISKNLNSSSYAATTVAAGMSLATVMIALLNLAPIMGIGLFVTVITYVLGLIFLLMHIPNILESNPTGIPIPDFLERRYQSKFVGKTGKAFSLVGYLSIFAMEILVGATVVKLLFPDHVMVFAIVFFGFLVLYTWLSGYRGIVATDKLQVFFIGISVAALIALCVILFDDHAVSTSNITTKLDWSPFKKLSVTLGFVIGIAVMNIPAAFSDTATWQRLFSTRDLKTAQTGLITATIVTFALWSILILIGLFVTVIGIANSTFDPTSEPTVDFVIRSFMELPDIFLIIGLFLFFSGLFSAMVSTADSLLMAATHIFLEKADDISAPHAQISLFRARVSMLVLSSLSLAIFITFNKIGFNVVQLVFAIYGAQLALFPSTYVAVMNKKRIVPVNEILVGLSIFLGFVSAWAIAIIGQVQGIWELQFYAPVAALLTSSVVLLVSFPLSKLMEK